VDRTSFPGSLDLTEEDTRRGPSLDVRLAQEEPDVAPSEAPLRPDEVDAPPVHQRLGTPVSLLDEDRSDRVGRLVAPDEGGPWDDESDAVAYDAGTSGGGPSAEEAAMHEVPDSEVAEPDGVSPD
jgi:hypothetical protein